LSGAIGNHEVEHNNKKSGGITPFQSWPVARISKLQTAAYQRVKGKIMAVQTKKKTRRQKKVAFKEELSAKDLAAGKQLRESLMLPGAAEAAAAAAAVENMLPKDLAKYLDNCGIKPSEAYFLGVTSHQFLSNLAPLQRDLIMSLLQLQTDMPDTP
jgi:hypothetical protein